MGYFDVPFRRPLPFLLEFRLCGTDIDSSMSQEGAVPQLESGSKLGYLFSAIEDKTLLECEQGSGARRCTVLRCVPGR